MNEVKSLLISNGINPSRLREKVNELSLYQLANSSNIHGNDISELLNEICSQADSLYLYRDNANIFDNLFNYLEENKVSLNDYIRKNPLN